MDDQNAYWLTVLRGRESRLHGEAASDRRHLINVKRQKVRQERSIPAMSYGVTAEFETAPGGGRSSMGPWASALTQTLSRDCSILNEPS